MSALVVVARAKQAGLGWETGPVSLKEGSSRAALGERQPIQPQPGAHGGPQGRKGSPPGLPAGHLSFSPAPSGFLNYSIFCRSPSRGQDGKCPSSSRCSSCKVSPKHSPDEELAEGALCLPGCGDCWFSAASPPRAFYPWVSLPGSRAMQCVQGRVRSASRGNERGRSSQERADACLAHF